MRITARTAPILLALTTGLAACGGGDGNEDAIEAAIEQAGGRDVEIDVDDDSGSYRVETDEGTFEMSTAAELPDDWPSDVPLPDGFVITGGSSIDGGSSGRLVAVSGTAPLTLTELDAFYAGSMGGWTESMRSSSNSGGDELLNVTFAKDGRMLTVGGVDRGDQTEVSFTYAVDPSGSEASATPGIDVDVDDLGIEGVDEALDAVGVEGIADAMVYALKADRYEIVGDTVHIYLGGSSHDAMMACIVASSLVTDNPVTIHEADGTSTDC